METSSIKSISDLRVIILTELDAYRKYAKEQDLDLDSREYGSESEYSINFMCNGIKSLMTDVAYLVASHEIFVRLSTYNERVEIKNKLTDLNSYIVRRQHSQIAALYDALKLLLRRFNLVTDKKRHVEFQEEINRLQNVALSLEDQIRVVNSKLQSAETIYDGTVEVKESFDLKYKEIIETKKSLVDELTTFKGSVSELNEWSKSISDKERVATQKINSIVSSEQKFQDFINKIQERETELEGQQKRTSDYDIKLQEYQTRHDKSLSEAESLIDKSRQALQYTTAQGMSAAFQTQYEDAKSKWITGGWLVGALLFVGATLALGLWLLTDNGVDESGGLNLHIFISRISMIPLTLAGAMFCARQYVKQKNLIEDYAYKTVLAKSIVAFSEELRQGESKNYSEYISVMLKEIHQDPLRTRGKEKDNEVEIKGTLGLFERIITMAKDLKQL